MSSPQTIPILHRSISLLKVIGQNEESLTAKSLSISLKIPPATCYRIIRTFLHHDWIQEDDAGGYRIAFGLAHLSRSYTALERRLELLAQPLRALTDNIGLSAKISLREGAQAVTVLRSDARKANTITSPVGTKMHLAEAGSAGVILMSVCGDEEIENILRKNSNLSQEQIRQLDIEVKETAKSKISQAFGTHHPSIYAMSIPLQLTKTDTAALTLVGWPDDFEGANASEIKKILKKTGAELQAILDKENQT